MTGFEVARTLLEIQRCLRDSTWEVVRAGRLQRLGRVRGHGRVRGRGRLRILVEVGGPCVLVRGSRRIAKIARLFSFKRALQRGFGGSAVAGAGASSSCAYPYDPCGEGRKTRPKLGREGIRVPDLRVVKAACVARKHGLREAPCGAITCLRAIPGR